MNVLRQIRDALTDEGGGVDNSETTKRPGLTVCIGVGMFLSICLGSVSAHDDKTMAESQLSEASRAGTRSEPKTALTLEAARRSMTDHLARQDAVLHLEGALGAHDSAASGQDGAGYIELDLATLQSLTPHRISTSTVVTDGVLLFEGVLMRSVMEHVQAHGKTVTAIATNGYQIDIPVQDFHDFDVLLAWAADGERLSPDDKGPFWIVYPRDQHDVLQDIRYDYRWVWQLKRLRVN